MSLETIQSALKERFDAPLPDFYTRRIIFWQDESREFEAMLDELAIPDVKIVRLTGTNSFSVKKLLLHDDLTSHYLVYNPFSYSCQSENWLMDIERFSESYRADYYSMLLDELKIEATPEMRETVQRYGAFFENRKNMEDLRRVGPCCRTPQELEINIMAVLARLNGGTFDDVVIATLSDGLDAENNAVLTNIETYGSIETFWRLLERNTGYVHGCEASLDDLAAHILLNALAQTMCDGLRGLERFISDGNQAYCYSIIDKWRNGGDCEKLYELCRHVESELNLPARFEKQDLEALQSADIFPSIHATILKRFFTDVSKGILKPDLILKTVEGRRDFTWYERFRRYYDCLYFIAEMQTFYLNNVGAFHIVEPETLWTLYAEKAYKMDVFYRRFHYAFGVLLLDCDALLDDLKRAADYVETLYDWFLKEINGAWTNAIADDLAGQGYVSRIERQRDFYPCRVRPLLGNKSRVFVVISDALRYETAAELRDKIVQENRGDVKLDAIQTVFPSITKFGMAALLPGRKLTLNEKLDVLLDEAPTRSTLEREKVLRAENPNSVAVQATDLIKMKRDERRKLIDGKEVVYIYHNVVDAMGDKPQTEKKVFEACHDAVGELFRILRIIISDMNGTDAIITADHGFLYVYRPLKEYDKVGKKAFNGKVHEYGRRYAITAENATADWLMPVKMDATLDGKTILGYTPKDATRIRISGGGENYTHGGVTLQEMATPVITFKNIRPSSKKYVEVSAVELDLLSECRRVSNMQFSLDFHQRQPVANKMKAQKYRVFMIDEEGRIVTDVRTIFANRTFSDASKRTFRARFNLQPGSYRPEKTYRLVICNEADERKEFDFHIDAVYDDDFGF